MSTLENTTVIDSPILNATKKRFPCDPSFDGRQLPISTRKGAFCEIPAEHRCIITVGNRFLCRRCAAIGNGFVSLFDGKTLDGWKIGDNAEVFQVRDGMIVMECPATNHQSRPPVL